MSKLLLSQRQIKKVVDVAEDLLGCRLNPLNNSLLWTSLNRPGMTLASPFHQKVTDPGREKNGAIHEDEAKVILKWIKKLNGSAHPLVKYARKFDGNLERDVSSFQLRSMIVLLVSNMFGVSSKVQGTGTTEEVDIINKQKALAEITETIYTAHMLHRTVVEIPKGQLPTLGEIDLNSSSDNGDLLESKGIGISMHHGNKVATLMGDLLLARCSKALASLRNSKVTEMMSDSIADFSESEAIFSAARTFNVDSRKALLNPGQGKDLNLILNFDKWMRRNSLGIGSLLQTACFSSLSFSDHNEGLRSLAGIIGYKIGLALQAHKDLISFENGLNLSSQIDLCSLPVIFQLEHNPILLSSSKSADEIYDEVRSSTYAETKTKETLLVLTEDAISKLSKFTGSSSKILQDFLTTLSTPLS